MSLFVFDLDGTLIDESYELKIEEIEALNKLSELGHKIAFASGRPLTGILKFATKLNNPENFYLLCSNGAEIYHKNKLLFSKYLGSAAFSEVFDYFGSNLDFTITAYANEKILYKNNYDIVKLEERSNSMPSLLVKQANIENVTKIMIRTEKTNAFDIVVPEQFYEEFEVAHTNSRWIEFTDKSVSKGTAIEFIVKRLRIRKDDVFVFGDSNNDTPAMKKYIGIAMSNAGEETKAAAKYITKSVYEHGVVYALKEILHAI